MLCPDLTILSVRSGSKRITIQSRVSERRRKSGLEPRPSAAGVRSPTHSWLSASVFAEGATTNQIRSDPIRSQGFRRLVFVRFPDVVKDPTGSNYFASCVSQLGSRQEQ